MSEETHRKPKHFERRRTVSTPALALYKQLFQGKFTRRWSSGLFAGFELEHVIFRVEVRKENKWIGEQWERTSIDGDLSLACKQQTYLFFY